MKKIILSILLIAVLATFVYATDYIISTAFIQPLPQNIIAGNSYLIDYNLTNTNNKIINTYFTFSINEKNTISPEEFNISFLIDNLKLNCTQVYPGNWKCTNGSGYYCFPQMASRNATVNLSINPLSSFSDLNYTLSIMGPSGCFGNSENTWETYDEVVDYNTCPPNILGDYCIGNKLFEYKCVNETTILKTEFNCDSLSGKYGKIFRNYSCSGGKCVYSIHEFELPRICIYNRSVKLGFDTKSGINPFNYRTSSYVFTGEQIEYDVIIRDYKGADNIGFLKAYVGDNPGALANEVPLNISKCDGLGTTNKLTDKQFHIVLTVKPSWHGENSVNLIVMNSSGYDTYPIYSENWFFNPAISIDVSTSDGNPIHFEQMPYGADTPEERTVHSVNKLKIKNTAEGGVNLWMFIAGTDLYDPSGASKCPTTNYIAIESKDFDGDGLPDLSHNLMQYRGWTGTQWQNGEGWKGLYKYNQNDGCNVHGTCYGGTGVPDDGPEGNILTNQGTLEVEFKLTYPMPCIGTFSDGTIYIFGKAI